MKTKLMAPEALKFAYNDCDSQWVQDTKIQPAIAALEADIAKPVEPHGWLIDGSLLYRLNEHGNNCDEINVSMANGSRTPEIRAFVAAALLTRITTPQEPEAAGLLDALKLLDDAYSESTELPAAGISNKELTRRWGIARAAIAKATGAPSCP